METQEQKISQAMPNDKVSRAFNFKMTQNIKNDMFKCIHRLNWFIILTFATDKETEAQRLLTRLQGLSSAK